MTMKNPSSLENKTWSDKERQRVLVWKTKVPRKKTGKHI